MNAEVNKSGTTRYLAWCSASQASIPFLNLTFIQKLLIYFSITLEEGSHQYSTNTSDLFSSSQWGCQKGLTYGQRPLSFAAWSTWTCYWFWSCQNGWCPQMARTYCRLVTTLLPFSRWLRFAVECCSLLETEASANEVLVSGLEMSKV